MAFRLVILLLACFAMAAKSESIHRFDTLEQKAQFEQLIQELRCPKCQNQSLADSDSLIASDLRKEVYRMIMSGKSDDQVKKYMVARYGEFVLYKPVFETHTLLLWFAPFVFLVLGGVAFFAIHLSQRKSAGEDLE